jgi:asparagine synthase (glutamine-hydrolysing)
MSFLNFGRTDYQVNTLPAEWLVAWGGVMDSDIAARGEHPSDRLRQPEVVWRDGAFAIVIANNWNWVISPSDRVVIVGDLWLSNRRELLTQLDAQGEMSDLEIVARLWERGGLKTLDLLQGMWCLAVWEKVTQQLFLVRDIVGARTIYYTISGATQWIAPRLTALNSYRSDNLDLIALRDYLTCSFVPGDRTLWQDVRELRPGSMQQFPGGKISTYWQLQEQVTNQASLEWHGRELRSILEQVVAEYLPAAEPVGIFLSGGLDSSCITALAAQVHDQPVHTYSIHFGAECANELEFSGLVAHHCQTQHHILEITWREMWEQLPQTMAYLDDPIGDPLTVPNLLVGQLASRDVRVTLNGEGGDPCFGGPKNQPMLINSLYRGVANHDAVQAYLVSFQRCAVDLPQLLKPDIWQQMQQPSVFEADLQAAMSYLNRLMALNIKFKGADQILTKVNNLTQAAGLHGRSPLFDRRIVEMSMAIPPEYKLSGVQEKAVLKQAVADLLPAVIIDRPKSGMMVPVQLGFRKYWQRQARFLLLDRRAMIAPYINQDLVKEWLNFRGDVWGRYGVKLWLLVSLEMWLQVNAMRRK